MAFFRIQGVVEPSPSFSPNFSSYSSPSQLLLDDDFEDACLPQKLISNDQTSVHTLRSRTVVPCTSDAKLSNLFFNNSEVDRLSSQVSSFHFHPEAPPFDTAKNMKSEELVISFGELPSPPATEKEEELKITFGEDPSFEAKNEHEELTIIFGEDPSLQAKHADKEIQITFGESTSHVVHNKKIRREKAVEESDEDYLPSNSLFQMIFKTKTAVLGAFGFCCEALTLFRKFEYLVTSSDSNFQMEKYDFRMVYRGVRGGTVSKEIHLIPVQVLQDRVWTISMPECHLKKVNVIASIQYKLKEASGFKDWEAFSNIKVHSAIKARYVRKLATSLPALSYPTLSSFQIVGQNLKEPIHSNFRPFFDLTPLKANVASVDEASLKIFKNAEGIKALIVTDFILQFPYPFRKIEDKKILNIFDQLKRTVRKPTESYLDFNYPFYSFQKYSVKDPFKFEDNPIFHKRIIIPSTTKAGLMLCNFIDPIRLLSHPKNRISPLEAWNQKSLKVSTIKAALNGKSALDSNRIDCWIQRYMPSSKQYCPTILIGLLGILEKELGISIRSLLDPCAGYGGRLTGACAALDYYLGVDPSSALHPKYQEIYQFLRSHGKTDTKIEMVQEPYEKADLEPYLDKLFGEERLQAPFDAVVSCPPYFALEIYSEEETQSVKNYPTLEGWMQHFLQPLIDKSARYLKPGGVLAINIRDCKTFKGSDEEYEICDPMNRYCLSRDDLEWVGVITVNGGAGVPTTTTYSKEPLAPKMSRHDGNVRIQSYDFIWIYRKRDKLS